MTQTPTKITKEEEKLIRLEKEFNEKIQKDPKFKKQIDNIRESLRSFSQSYKNQTGSIFSDEQMRKISEEADIDIDSIEEELNKKNINILREEINKNFNILREELKKNIDTPNEETEKVKNRSLMCVEITETGNFYYKNKKLCVGTNSNAGKFFEYSLKDKNHFVPDSFCTSKLQPQIKNIRRDLNNKYLKKDGLKAIYKRSGDGNGYILIKIIELRLL